MKLLCWRKLSSLSISETESRWRGDNTFFKWFQVGWNTPGEKMATVFPFIYFHTYTYSKKTYNLSACWATWYKQRYSQEKMILVLGPEWNCGECWRLCRLPSVPCSISRLAQHWQLLHVCVTSVHGALVATATDNKQLAISVCREWIPVVGVWWNVKLQSYFTRNKNKHGESV